MDEIKLKDIAASFATDGCADAIYPAHLFRALLHKEMGMVSYIETTLSKDYYYILDWVEVQMQLSPKSLRPQRYIEYSKESQEVLDEADNYRRKMGLDSVEGECVLAALVTPGVGFSFDQLKTLPLTAADICGKAGVSTAAATPQYGYSAPKGAAGGDALQKYCTDRTAEARDGKLPAVVGFETEVEMIYEILGRRMKANMLITGEAGVGKTSLVNAFVHNLAENKVPEFLQNHVAYELDVTSLAQDSQYKGEIEERLKSLLNEVAERGNIILIIEQVDKFFDKQGQLFNASSLLKQELTRGRISVICTSSIEGYTKNIETDKEMLNKFEKFNVDEPDTELTMQILRGAMPPYCDFHGVTVNDAVLDESIRLAKRYLNERSLPDTAIDLLDRSMARLKTQNSKDAGTAHTELNSSDLCAVIAEKTGVPMGKVQTQERDRLMGAEETLKQRVVGQDHAVKKVLDAIFEARSGLQKKGQPMGSFFFLGPTGTGKTELSKALAAFLFNDESSLIRFDMSEFKEEHSVALLYGAPPGYVGYEEGGLLVNKIRQNPYSVVLFDEIEKAHKSVFDLFLQILDEGKLHDRLGRVGDFSNALILFTSNIGSKFVVEQFGKGVVPQNNDLMEIMQDYFRPEFLGRLSEIIPFSPITEESVTAIFDIHFKGVLKLLQEQNIELTITPEARKKIALMGYNPQYGARPVIGIIRKEIRNPLSKMIISGKIKSGDKVEISVAKGKKDEETIEFNIN